jgi:gamma-glutamylcyclotransferase (GGCT)/AIG2-like uncharacterized protein YtfP
VLDIAPDFRNYSNRFIGPEKVESNNEQEIFDRLDTLEGFSSRLLSDNFYTRIVTVALLENGEDLPVWAYVVPTTSEFLSREVVVDNGWWEGSILNYFDSQSIDWAFQNC